MDTNTFGFLSVILTRFVGFIILADSLKTLKGGNYYWLTFGWFLYFLSPIFGLFRSYTNHPIVPFLYLALALEGVYFLTSGAIWIFKPFALKKFFWAGLFFFVIAGLGYFLGGERIIAISVPALQFVILSVVSIIAILKRTQYKKIAGSSIYWLLAIFIIGIPQAVAYIVIQPSQAPFVSLLLTNFTSMLIAVYFIQLQHNISQVQLRDSESRYKLLVENQTDFIIKISPEGKFLYMNPKFMEIFGILTSDIENKNIFSIIHPDDAHIAVEAFTSLQRPPFTKDLEARGKTVNGWRWVAWSGRAMLDHSNRLIAIIASGRDIEDRKNAETKIRDLNQDLELRVLQRTSQLDNLNKDLKTFTYSVTHDLKAPLRHIAGYSRILDEDYGAILDSTGRSYIDRIIRSVEKMRDLIDDLLIYSRLDSIPWSPGKISLNALFDKLLSDYALEISDYNFQVSMRLEINEIFGDEECILQALTNVLDNAIKYTKNQNNPQIQIGSKKIGTSIQIWIKDNGVGFDMNFHDQIFTIFHRLHTEGEFPGTGIGLAIAVKAIQRLQGKIWAVSEPGSGSTFYLEIPDNILE